MLGDPVARREPHPVGRDDSLEDPCEVLVPEGLVDHERVEWEGHDAAVLLGVGEARYKTTICDDSDDLVDTFFPLTARGRAYARYSQAKRALKRRIKTSPLALKAAQRVLGLLKRRRPQGDGED